MLCCSATLSDSTISCNFSKPANSYTFTANACAASFSVSVVSVERNTNAFKSVISLFPLTISVSSASLSISGTSYPD